LCGHCQLLVDNGTGGAVQKDIEPVRARGGKKVTTTKTPGKAKVTKSKDKITGAQTGVNCATATVTSPSAPVSSPIATVISPTAPVSSDPVTSPTTPVTSPTAPVSSPTTPVTSATATVTSPTAPVTSPTAPVTAVQKDIEPVRAGGGKKVTTTKNSGKAKVTKSKDKITGAKTYLGTCKSSNCENIVHSCRLTMGSKPKQLCGSCFRTKYSNVSFSSLTPRLRVGGLMIELLLQWDLWV
jgi:hypothetical protein